MKIGGHVAGVPEIWLGEPVSLKRKGIRNITSNA